jgi:hypothetical protein
MNLGEELFDALGRVFKVLTHGAVFGFLATTIVAHAAPDLAVGGTIRSYALSGVVEAEGGYGVLLWGDPASPFYGYLRPRLYGSSAYTYNSLDTAVEVFPISFLGMRAGGEASQNDQKYSAYDCNTFRCLGRFYRAYFEAEFSAGAGPVFVHGSWRRERWSQRDGTAGDFIDPTSGLAMRGGGDSQTVYYGVGGVKVDPNWSVVAVLRYAQSDPRDFSRLLFEALRYHDERLTLSLGAGIFESTLKKQGLTVAGFVRWEIWPSLALH